MNRDENVIELRCRKCNKHVMDYTPHGMDTDIVLQGICMKCDRCKRVMTFVKYTEGYLKSHQKKGIFKI
ncbi:MAG: hypothetical protein ACI4FX_05635 [Agathobacter sp.]